MLFREGKLKEFIITKPLLYEMLKGLKKKKKIKTMNIKMAINSQLSIIEYNNKPSKQARQKQNHRYGDHLESYQLGGGRDKWEKVQEIRSIADRYRMDRRILRRV